MSDFGLATEADCAQTQRMFPIKWTAPEALKDSVCTVVQIVGLLGYFRRSVIVHYIKSLWFIEPLYMFILFQMIMTLSNS